MEDQQRDFNTVAKVLLGLSLFSTVISILNSISRISIDSYMGMSNMMAIKEIIIDVLIICAGILTYMKKRYGLIAFTFLFIIRIFATIPTNTDIAYSYLLGSKLAPFIKDFIPFGIAMCFKKDGISGWKSMLGSYDVISNISVEAEGLSDEPSTTTSCNEQTDRDQNSADIHEDGFASIKKSDEVTSPILSRESESSDLYEFVENVESKQDSSIKVSSSEDTIPNGAVVIERRNIVSTLSWKKILAILLPSVVVIGCGVFAIIINNQDGYMDTSTTFTDKVKEYFYLPNNSKVEELLEKAQNAYDKGLYLVASDAVNHAFLYFPSDQELIKRLSSLSYNIYTKADDAKDCLDHTIELARDLHKIAPNDVQNMELLSKALLADGNYEESSQIAQEILLLEESSVAFAVLEYNSLDKQNWNDLLNWSIKGIAIDSSFYIHHYMMAKALKEVGRINEAYEEFVVASQISTDFYLYDELVELKPKSRPHLSNLLAPAKSKRNIYYVLSALTLNGEHMGTQVYHKRDYEDRVIPFMATKPEYHFAVAEITPVAYSELNFSKEYLRIYKSESSGNYLVYKIKPEPVESSNVRYWNIIKDNHEVNYSSIRDKQLLWDWYDDEIKRIQ